ncbi:MAG: hypothetical protein WKG32_21785 [Gemmatimonadaceae bacterium]
MYSTCLFCHADLGTNEAIEHFPVGRRLAFDGARGRLWVVCRKCGRWNLSPLEERWEAIEECERLFRDTRLRVSTDNIGLAKLPEGLELVRIGEPQRPEFAAWRYGGQFGRRRRTTMIQVGLGLGVLGAIAAGGAAAGVGIGGFGWSLYQLANVIVKGSPGKVIARLPREGDEPLIVKRKHLPHLHLFAGAPGEWSLGVPHRKQLIQYSGEPAVRAVGTLLPQLNRFGGTKERVNSAVEMLQRQADPLHFFATAAGLAQRAAKGEKPTIQRLPEEVRLALEMAAHEEAERRAFEGELALLEQAWREAEEVAAIADNLFLPTSVDDFFRRARGERSRGERAAAGGAESDPAGPNQG